MSIHHRARPKYRRLEGAAITLAVLGLIRLAFNVAGIRVFGPETIGGIQAIFSLLTIAAAVLASAPGALASKLLAEPAEEHEPEYRERVASGALKATALAGIVLAIAIAALRHPSRAPFAAAYLPLFGLYIVLKEIYLARGLRARAGRADLLGAAAFAIAFTLSCVTRSPDGAIASLLLHPACFVLMGLIENRAIFRFDRSIRAMARTWRRRTPVAAAAFVSAMSGMAPYHVIVVASSFFLDGATLGYFTVLLAAASAITFIPTVYGGRLFPELTLRHDRHDHDGMRVLVHRSTLGLQAVALIAAGPLLVWPDAVMAMLGVPPLDEELRSAWCWLVLAAVAAAPSVPSRYFLDDTRYREQNAMIGSGFLVLGVVGGFAAINAWWVAGAGIMRFLIDVPVAWTRMGLAQHVLGWTLGRASAVLAGQLAIVLLFSSGRFGWPWAVGLLLWLAASVLEVSVVSGLARTGRQLQGAV